MSNNITYHEFGRYGEHFLITQVEEDKYLVSCYELDMDYDDPTNHYLTQEEFDDKPLDKNIKYLEKLKTLSTETVV